METKIKSPKNEAENLARIGIRGLDDVLAGGLTPNRLYLLDGDPGSGKTTIALQFLMQGVLKGETTLYVTLAETIQELKAVADSHGWNLEGIELLEIIPGGDALSTDDQITMFHPSEVELGEATEKILAAVEKLKPKRVVIDSLSELRLLSQHSLRYRRQILALKRFFMGRECTVMLLDDRTADAADRQPYSIAHGVITLEQLTPEYGSERRRLNISKYRGSSFRGGFHDFVIRQGGIDVFPRLVAGEYPIRMNRVVVPSSLQTLDDLLGGGLTSGTSTLITGPAGSGKSSLAMQYVVAACERGENVAIALFDESVATLVDRMHGMGRSIEKYIDNGQIAVHQIDPAEFSPGQLVHLLREQVEERGVKMIVLDSLNGYMHSMPGENFLTVQLHELTSYFGHRGVTTILVTTQQGMIGPAMRSPVDATYLADCVIMMRYFEDRGRVRKAISVVKKRTGYHEDTIREMSIDSRGLHVGEPLTDFRGVLTGVPERRPIEDSKARGN
ncbi:ATPase domain-containing protein [Anatilimnocola floriformis]|uniref:ATPase domain-containing protein n=1 Tax=Anatilimnocola floriformis TaxID=2948575 RepID=UPI0020C24AAA|nr:ATPase domain-containing protein [Anatilimnocola floriformis]